MRRHTDDRELDGRTLSQCDEELGALRSIQKQLERRVASVCRKRNTFSPVNALPPELLVIIFRISIDSEPVMVWSDRGSFMLVCHYWNHLVNNTPSLWTKIQKSAVPPNAFITRALENSKDSPLEIEYNAAYGRTVQADENAFLSAIFLHAHRWRKATLSVREGAQELERMTTLSAPLLESLSLSALGDPERARDEPLDIFGGRPPAKLQELFLECIPVPWSPKTLCNLKVLDITSIHHLSPSLDQLFAILSASPSLESLSILNVSFSGDANAPLPNPIHMSTLKKLSLKEISPKITNRILAAIHAPECKFGSLRPAVQVDPFETIFTPDVSHFFDHIRSSAYASSVFCGVGDVTISWEGSWHIVLDVENIRIARRLLDWLSVSPEPKSPAVPLHLTIIESDSHLVEDILAVMADTEAVHRVTFGYQVPVAGALGMLATGSLVEGSAPELYPTLEEMWIGKSMDDDEWEHLLRMLRKRLGETEARDGDQHVKPLRRLELGGDWYTEDDETVITEFRLIHWPNRLEEVRRLLGHDGVLLWYRWIVTEDGTLQDQPGYRGWNN
ncbi:hypothetical protein M407DRAFT_20891 [Tulasnella calospora MUT 4182]|uniref:F-box domain-containing protein n=1 Tax=Tulasnella calospora MUT 4182 TaxID=1051891 RepID=A0A0C3QQW0_9AGAM|nr:hypothetical protein M407DRAFT_20891 [Tulasnella calospora MUT 4182]